MCVCEDVDFVYIFLVDLKFVSLTVRPLQTEKHNASSIFSDAINFICHFQLHNVRYYRQKFLRIVFWKLAITPCEKLSYWYTMNVFTAAQS